MTRVRRSRYAFFYLEDDYPLDLSAILVGELPVAAGARIVGLSVLTGEHHLIEADEFRQLWAIPSDHWSPGDTLDETVLRGLSENGFLISTARDAHSTRLREREERLAANEWNPYAALYHYMTQWSSFDIRDGAASFEVTPELTTAAQGFIATHGPPPPEFAEPRGVSRVTLPAIERSGDLYHRLRSRKTTRAFARDQPMTLDQLDTVLRYVFGCHGYAVTSPGVVLIKRTSPSGGGLHPIELYPIVTNVTGIEPGIYHYSPRDHSLGLLEALSAEDGVALATSLMCGQSYFGAAHVSFVLTARFYRNHWKYRRQHRAYVSILMDAAHLSQTLYLVSDDLGLGAFLTIAINGRDVEKRLGLDGIDEGVIAMAGCGLRDPSGSPLELRVSGGLEDFAALA